MISGEHPTEPSPQNSALRLRTFTEQVIEVGQKNATPNLAGVFSSNHINEITPEMIHSLLPSMRDKFKVAGEYLLSSGVSNRERVFTKIKHILIGKDVSDVMVQPEKTLKKEKKIAEKGIHTLRMKLNNAESLSDEEIINIYLEWRKRAIFHSKDLSSLFYSGKMSKREIIEKISTQMLENMRDDGIDGLFIAGKLTKKQMLQIDKELDRSRSAVCIGAVMSLKSGVLDAGQKQQILHEVARTVDLIKKIKFDFTGGLNMKDSQIDGKLMAFLTEQSIDLLFEESSRSATLDHDSLLFIDVMTLIKNSDSRLFSRSTIEKLDRLVNKRQIGYRHRVDDFSRVVSESLGDYTRPVPEVKKRESP